MGRSIDTRWEQYIIRKVIFNNWNYSKIHTEIVRLALSSEQEPLSLSTVRRRVKAAERYRDELTQYLDGTLPLEREGSLLQEVRQAMYLAG